MKPQRVKRPIPNPRREFIDEIAGNFEDQDAQGNIDGLRTADGFDGAILGICEFWGMDGRTNAVLYDRDKCIDILVKRDGMSHEEAEEYFDFNVAGAYVGPFTPVFATLVPGTVVKIKKVL
jgi:hypothetical protein